MPILSGTDERAVQAAARALADGDLVAFPTETVYGLGARADDDSAVARIFAANRVGASSLANTAITAALRTQALELGCFDENWEGDVDAGW